MGIKRGGEEKEVERRSWETGERGEAKREP